MNNKRVVALTFDSSKFIDIDIDIDIEFDTPSLVSVGSCAREPTLHMQALERLAMSQTLDDLQRLVWP